MLITALCNLQQKTCFKVKKINFTVSVVDELLKVIERKNGENSLTKDKILSRYAPDAVVVHRGVRTSMVTKVSEF
jgi:hypothetical protein